MSDTALEETLPKKAHGSAHPAAKLVEEQVVQMRELYKLGASIMGLSRRFGVSPTAIRSAIRRKTWAHV